jgi:hypothetical protein
MRKQTENRIAHLIEKAKTAGLVVIDETTTDEEGREFRSVKIEEYAEKGTWGSIYRRQYEIYGRVDGRFVHAYDWTVGRKKYKSTIREIERYVYQEIEMNYYRERIAA